MEGIKLPEIAPGRVVLYKLSEVDAHSINRQRSEAKTCGNYASQGDVYPAIIVRTWGQPGQTLPDDASVNIQVLLDGPDTYWATSRHHRSMDSFEEGTFAWPMANYPGPSV